MADHTVTGARERKLRVEAYALDPADAYERSAYSAPDDEAIALYAGVKGQRLLVGHVCLRHGKLQLQVRGSHLEVVDVSPPK